VNHRLSGRSSQTVRLTEDVLGLGVGPLTSIGVALAVLSLIGAIAVARPRRPGDRPKLALRVLSTVGAVVGILLIVAGFVVQ
jgi:hypothetical protein